MLRNPASQGAKTNITCTVTPSWSKCTLTWRDTQLQREQLKNKQKYEYVCPKSKVCPRANKVLGPIHRTVKNIPAAHLSL